MYQVLQNIRNGKLNIANVPEPTPPPGHVLIANRSSLISAGTEKMARELAQKSLWAKARSRPDHVVKILQKVRSQGLLTTARQVWSKLDEPMSMGYCSAGQVLACGAGVQEFKPGDRVASNGPHAEVVYVPRHLCARIPDEVAFDHAAFTVLGAIALQGIRLSQVVLGETALVIGLGLVGQITVALLKAAGVRVLGTDLDPTKCKLALTLGADLARPLLSAEEVMAATAGLGADAVLITASTQSDEPVKLAGEAVRRKGRVVAVGAVGMNLPRRAYYFKEAEFVVSCSYGPGRYDPKYEAGGQDYPAAYVRWTEQRNMQAVLDLMAAGRLDLRPLISHRFPIDQAAGAYDLMELGSEPYLGIVLDYPVTQPEDRPQRLELTTRAQPTATPGAVNVGCLGAGNFARRVLLPEIARVRTFQPRIICSASGTTAAHAGRQFKFAAATSHEAEVLENPDVQAVFVLTRHDQHARQTIEAVRAGKHVFVEKPLALNAEELDDIEQALRASENRPLVTVGFNRRFSPAARLVREFFADVREPLTVSIRMASGALPADHWLQDPLVGGGRIIGEACHAIDLATFLTGSLPARVFAESISGLQAPAITDDQCYVTLRHANGAVSNVAYLSGGDAAFPKERVEVFGGGKVAVIDDFCSVVTCSGGRQRKALRGRQDKGHRAEIEAFARAILDGGVAPISWAELRAVTSASFLAVKSLHEGAAFEL